MCVIFHEILPVTVTGDFINQFVLFCTKKKTTIVNNKFVVNPYFSKEELEIKKKQVNFTLLEFLSFRWFRLSNLAVPDVQVALLAGRLYWQPGQVWYEKCPLIYIHQ